MQTMLALLVQTLFALQGATKGNGSYSSHPSGLRLPSPPFIIRKAQGRNTLFASPKLQAEETDHGETLDWLQARIGFSDEKLAKLVQLQPTILNMSVRERLEPNIAWLQDRLALDQEGLQRVVLRLTPMVGGLAQLLGSSMEENLEPTLVWLQERLLLDDSGVAKLVKECPSFLGFSLELHQEKMTWLQKRLALDDKSLSKLVQSHPSVLGCSIDDNLEPTLSWLQERLSLDDKSLSKLVKTLPSALSLSI
jgi:mTERF domain-containing protein